MTGEVTALYRHPIKGHGREALQSVSLEAGKTMPGDRVWAVANQLAKVAPGFTDWALSTNWSRGSKCPELMAINSRLNEDDGTVTLTHFTHGEITLDPDNAEDVKRLIAWTAPLMPEGTMSSHYVVRTAKRGMTDTNYASISINSMTSLRAVNEAAGQDLSPLRWRGNIWLETDHPWQEFEWVGRSIRIGGAEFEVRERILRCPATTANPETGERDFDTLQLLRDTWQHQEFGVYATVTKGGQIKLGDQAELI